MPAREAIGAESVRVGGADARASAAAGGRVPATSGEARRWPHVWLSVGSLVVGLGLWELVGSLKLVNPILLSPPRAVVQAALDLLRSGELVAHFWVSLGELTTGLGLAVAVGIPVGVLAGWFRRVEWALRPLTGAFYATPVIVFAPLIVAWLGIGFWDKVLLVFLEAFFQVFVTVSAGVRALDDAWLRVARAFAAGTTFTFRTVVVPGSVPFVLTGIRLATGRALVTVVVAELLASTAGLGWMIAFYGQNFKIANVFVALVVTAGLGVVSDAVLRHVERRVESWRPGV
jgi:ABC-type nitrate/sulfonate/bicarbonate transport system permease component